MLLKLPKHWRHFFSRDAREAGPDQVFEKRWHLCNGKLMENMLFIYFYLFCNSVCFHASSLIFRPGSWLLWFQTLKIHLNLIGVPGSMAEKLKENRYANKQIIKNYKQCLRGSKATQARLPRWRFCCNRSFWIKEPFIYSFINGTDCKVLFGGGHTKYHTCTWASLRFNWPHNHPTGWSYLTCLTKATNKCCQCLTVTVTV